MDDIPQLLTDARKGNLTAQKRMFDWLSDSMMLLCKRYVKNSEDAEEAMLDGFYKFFTHLSTFTYQNEATLIGWIKKIMINECLMQLRKKNAFVMLSDSVAEDIEYEDDALNRLSAKEIFELILRLPSGYRTVFNLYEIEGMNHKEIADLMGIAEGTSKSQLSKAKALLQRNLLQTGSDYAKRKK